MKKLLLTTLVAGIIPALFSSAVSATTKETGSPEQVLVNDLSSTEKVSISSIVSEKYVPSDTDYTVLEKPLEHIAPVAEFFSFRCSYCAFYDKEMRLSSRVIGKFLKSPKEFEYINIDYKIQNSVDITRAWLTAKSFGDEVANEFKRKLFEGFHEKYNIQSSEDLYAIFDELKLDKLEVQKRFNSPEIEKELLRIMQLDKVLNQSYTPVFVVKGKYVLNVPSIGKNITDTMIMEHRLLDTIDYLLNK